MRVSHSFPAIAAVFDDPNLVSCAGLAPTLALAQRAELTKLVADTLTHLPRDWPWQNSWEGLFNAACGSPTPATT